MAFYERLKAFQTSGGKPPQTLIISGFKHFQETF